MPRLWTVGHGTLDAGAFAALVNEAGIEVIVDVRRFPGSRRNPQYGSDQMAAWLPKAGVEYEWAPSLGGRRKPAADSPNTGLRNAQFRAYADHMATAEFKDGLSRLLATAAERSVAVMCAESVWWRCHRRLLSDHLVLINGWDVEHVMHDGRRADHRLTPGARAVGELLIYGGDVALPLGELVPGHIVLVGLMGSGKTTVGRELAVMLGRPLIDNDEQVLAMTGRTVAEISVQAGVAEMRRLEGEALAQALASPVPAVITAAAGVILDDRARSCLTKAFVVWLRADPATLTARVARDAVRPLLGDDPEGVFGAMQQQRHRLYAEVADYAVDVDQLTPAEAASAIAAHL